MKFNIYTLIVLITIGFLLAGCAQQSSDKATVSQNRTAIENTKTSPPRAVEINHSAVTGDNAKAITVYKSPTCGCCSMWEAHLSKAGFKVTSKTTDDMTAVRKQFGVPDKMQSCHTGVIDGYVIEGHVPAPDIKKLLETRPDGVAGLAAPGMPAKSPGMQPEGERPSGYDVLSFDRQGNSQVFASY